MSQRSFHLLNIVLRQDAGCAVHRQKKIRNITKEKAFRLGAPF